MNETASPVAQMGRQVPAPAPMQLLATLGPAAVALATALRDVLPEGRSASVVIDPTTELPVDAGVLVLVSHPAGTVARAMARGEDADAALASWSNAARALLRQAYRRARPPLFIDADEALAAPAALAETLAAWDDAFRGLQLRAVVRPESQPMPALLAREAAGADVAALRLFSELQARCAVAPNTAAAIASTDWRQALQDWRHDQASLAGLEAREALSVAKAEQLRGALAEAEARTALARQELAAAQHDAEELRSQLELARNAAAVLQRDAELAALQIEQAQEELDTKLESSRSAAGVPARVRAEALRIVDHADRAPHRHLHVDLHRASSGDRRWHALEVRLLEHHGRPGLALFSTGQPQEVLSAWKPSGKEQAREYMLFVPSDRAGEARIAALGASDWRMLRGLADLLVVQLQTMGGDVAADWAQVARRLQSDLHGLPPRLRYDGGTAARDGDQWRVEFREACFGEAALERICLRWSPATGELGWLAPEGRAALPLAGWPRDGRSALAATFVVPIGPGGGSGARRRWWAAQPAANRALLLCVLEALPEVLRRDSATAIATDDARAACVSARKAVRWAGLHDLARRVLRRGATPTAASA